MKGIFVYLENTSPILLIGHTELIIDMKYLSLCFLFSVIIFENVLAQADSSGRTNDSCRLYLSKSVNIYCFKAQVGSVTDEQLRAVYNPNILDVLTGKVCGLEIKTASSGNSASSAFFMRGYRDIFQSNQPLYVVDGVPVEGNLSSVLGLDYGNIVNAWNLDDIQSVYILKGSQAAALYGMKAGNGAVIINTKQATKPGFHIDYNTSAMIRSIADYPQFQNEYGQGYDGVFSYENGLGGGVFDDVDMNWGPKLNGQLINQFDGISNGLINGQQVVVRGGDIWAREQAALNGLDASIQPTPWVAQPDNMKDYFRTSFMLSNNLAVSYFQNNGSGLRISYSDTRGGDVTPNSKFLRNSLSSNFNIDEFKNIKFFGSLYYTKQKEGNAISNDISGANYPMQFFSWLGRQVNLNNLKDYWQAGQQGVMQFNYIGKFWNNPWLIASESISNTRYQQLFGTLGTKIVLFRRMSLTYVAGSYRIDAKGELSDFPVNTSGWQSHDQSEETDLTYFRHSILADYNFKVAKENYFSAFLGWYLYDEKFHQLSDMNNGVSETDITEKTNGINGGFSYSFKDAFHFRLDVFIDKYKPLQGTKMDIINSSVSGGINFEKIFHLPKVISALGIQSGCSYGTRTGEFSNQSTTSNEIKPESFEYTLSSDLGFMENRLVVHYNLYFSRITNHFYSNSFFPININNKGSELVLDITPVQRAKFVWKSDVIFFRNRNKIKDLGELSGITHFTNGATYSSYAGHSYGDLYGTGFKRFSGQIIYKNGLPEIAEDDFLGNTNPDFIIYQNNTFRINKLTVYVSIGYNKGGIYYSSFYANGTLAGTLSNSTDRENGIIGEGLMWDEVSGSYIPNNVEVSAQGYFSKLGRITEYSVMDATYLKLQEISVSYPFRIRNVLNLSCDLFGQNLLTLSKNKDYNNSTLYFHNNIYYRVMNYFNLPDKYTLGFKIQMHI